MLLTSLLTGYLKSEKPSLLLFLYWISLSEQKWLHFGERHRLALANADKAGIGAI